MPATRRRQIYRRRRIVVLGGLALILAGVVYATATLLAPLPATAVAVAEPALSAQPAAQLAMPAFGATAVGAVGFTGILASSGEQGSMPIASIAKVITALVVLEAKPLAAGETGPTIEYTDSDVDYYYEVLSENGSVAPVVAGMTLSERDTLTAMLLPSANNYSISLANWAYGSVDAYLAAANAWLAAHGLTATSVADTSGLSPASVSSPADLVEIGKLAIAHPVIAEIVALPSAELPTIGTVVNTNKMLGLHGVDGVKTGTTDEAGACLLYTADYTIGMRTVTVVGVTLGGGTHPELDDAIGALLDSVAAGFHEVPLANAGQGFAEFSTVWGQTASAVASTDASALLWSDAPATVSVVVEPVLLAAIGDEVGTVTFTVGEQTIAVPLIVDEELSDPGPWWRIGHPGELASAGSS
ncbi:D-alanyl-D-alanine carboxypeptidase family protein [Luethyella okanaganae]|uniref:D-alanyl-D-alanine carboxypeptidase family protein n=1 Tax=Luethyella okanaganae TaxID=69372 RepID=A0ABW1VCX6_9MICO